MNTVLYENVAGIEKFEESVINQRNKMGDVEGTEWQVIGESPNRELQWNIMKFRIKELRK